MRLLAAFLSICCLSTADATELTLGCGNSLPPYVIEHNDRGIALELMQRAMRRQGYRIEVLYGSNSDLAARFNRNELDILCISNREISPDAYFFAEPLLVFRNFGVSLANRRIRLADVSALADYRVGAFNFAQHLLPPPFSATVEQSPLYTEYTDQRSQVQDLFNGKVDVIVIDRMIFRYFMSRLRRTVPDDQALKARVEYHALFPDTRYFVAFHSAELRNAFDEGMKQLRRSGEHQQIIAAYDRILSEYLFQ